MFCGNCGCEVTEGMHYCSNCGAKLEVVISPVQRPEDRAAAREEAEPYIPASQAAEPEPAIPAGSAPGIAPGQTAAQVPGSGAPQAAPSAPDPTVYQPPTASAAPFSVPAASAVPFSGPAANTVRGVNAPFAWIAAAAALAALAAQFRTGNALSQIFLTSLELLVLMLTAISASKQIRLTALPALIHLIVLGISVYQAARATSANLTLMSGYLRSQALTLIVYLRRALRHRLCVPPCACAERPGAQLCDAADAGPLYAHEHAGLSICISFLSGAFRRRFLHAEQGEGAGIRACVSSIAAYAA